jgi:hypothetical protein
MNDLLAVRRGSDSVRIDENLGRKVLWIAGG